jgi:hypothetical protein
MGWSTNELMRTAESRVRVIVELMVEEADLASRR